MTTALGTLGTLGSRGSLGSLGFRDIHVAVVTSLVNK
jgi:hypothetical protein